MKGAVGYMLKDWNRPERPSDEEIDTRLKIARESDTQSDQGQGGQDTCICHI